jgi:hypothetical protein
LETLDGYSELSSDVKVKLSRASETLLKRVEEVWRAIEDCIIFSSPEKVGKPLCAFTWRIWKWCISNAIHSVDNVTVAWKSFCKHIQVLNANSEYNTLPEIHSGFPACGPFKVGKAWYTYLPWLKHCYSSPNKYLQEKFAHLCNSRGCPPPSMSPGLLESEFDKMRGRLTRHWPVSSELCLGVFNAARQLALYNKAGTIESAAHVSMSTMASYNSPRNKGGRATEFCSDFIHDYVTTLANESRTEVTWFGTYYRTKKGRPKFETMCREFPLKEKNYDFLLSNFESRFTIPWDPGYKIEEPIIGIDAQFGCQMLQHAIETGISKGYLLGSPYKCRYDKLRLSGVPPPVRAEPLGEGGAKLRWITVSESWLNILLQPLGHELGRVLREDPFLKSGFVRSWKGYDYANDLAWHKGLEVLEPYFVVQGDLKVATDNMVHDYVSCALKGYLEGAGRLTHFNSLCVDLLCSPRAVYRGTQFRFNSKSGILMGDPLTKPALSIMTRVARHLAIYRYAYEKVGIHGLFKNPYPQFNWDIGRSAGDDFVEIGPISFLNLVKTTHQVLGHVVGTYIISQRIVRYCEEPLLFQGKRTFHGKPLWAVEDYQSTIHVDALKVRIFSPCGSVSPGSISDFKNPVIGKGQALSRKLPWLPPSWQHLRKSFILRWGFRMNSYMDLSEPYWYLPRLFGGGDLPSPFEWEDVVEGTLNRCPKYFLAVKSILDGCPPFWLEQMIQQMASGCISRGAEFSLKQAAHEGYVMSAEIAGYQKSQEEIAELLGLKPEEFNNMPRALRTRKAEEVGYIPEFSLDVRIEKAWLLKSAFQRAFRKEEVVEPKTRLDPSRIWCQVSDLINSMPSLTLPYESETVIAEAFLEFLKTSKRPKESKNKFLLKECLSRNFGALMTPLPGRLEDISCVRGSLADVL